MDFKAVLKTENNERVLKALEENFDSTPPPRQAINKIRDRFNDTDSVGKATKSGRFRTLTTEENEIRVILTFVNSSIKSTRHTKRLMVFWRIFQTVRLQLRNHR